MTTTPNESVPLIARKEEKLAGRGSRFALGASAAALAMGVGIFALSGLSKGGQIPSSLSSSSSRIEPKLGAAQTITLGTGCSPLGTVSFDPTTWTGVVGAKLITNSMSTDFRFENALDMTETSCGQYSVEYEMVQGEQFGFYLYPIGNTTDGAPVKDIGCSDEGDQRCPDPSSPAALAGMTACTTAFEENGNTFYNRVFDGSTTSYQWGTCDSCAGEAPQGCEATSSATTYDHYEILEGDVTCESKGLVTIVDIDECQVAGATLSGDPNKGFRYDQPEGGYTDSSSSRTRGCTFHSGNVNNDLQFFPNAQGACGTSNFDCVCGATSSATTYDHYEILEGDVTCESKGWVTIVDIDECQVAGATLSGDPNKGFRYDQPEGGYTDSSSSRTRGCTFHSGNVNNDLQFFPNAQGACGTSNFDCVCGVK